MRVPLPAPPAFAVKVCGVRRVADARACVAAGADFAGLNRVAGARRAVEPQRLAELRAALGPVQAVLLYRDAAAAQILAEAEALDIGWVQLHGDEPLAVGQALRAAGLRLIRALPDTAERAALLAWQAVADVLLLDGVAPGAGQPRPWQLPAGLDPARLWLAGGLSPRNVAQALQSAPASGVDAASGLEADGQLDPHAIAAFVAASRQAARHRSTV